ncbi:sigma-70 family RNA polymerase sigma factor [Kitasatospora sp. NPDC059571]|uniref:sigma-70 family RNA polymerase sigma factor n=1 Tax=Kitasatospora sp. NPDC059571 TaxID=3346871 RepID=UPI0036A407B4
MLPSAALGISSAPIAPFRRPPKSLLVRTLTQFLRDTDLTQDNRSDDSFLRDLYAAHRGSLLRYVMKTGGIDSQAAEDLVQETFLRAWRHAGALRESADRVRPWLLRVARNLVIDASRARSARPVETEQQSADTAAVADSSEQVVEARCVAFVLAELSPVHREVLVHLHCLDRSVGDTARSIGIPLGTVKSRNHYALKELRRALVRHGIR